MDGLFIFGNFPFSEYISMPYVFFNKDVNSARNIIDKRLSL